MPASTLTRRARPLLGTLVEAGADLPSPTAAFDAIEHVQRCMSRFDPRSDIARFNTLPCGASIEIDPDTATVLVAAALLQAQSQGRFDVSLGSAPGGWTCDGQRLHKTDAAARLDLGGIAKGHAVDRAVRALQAAGATRGWVNAGGDLRVFGDIELPVRLRDELAGGVRDFGRLADGAMATSHFHPTARSRHAAGALAHVTVIAPQCLWADALTKLAANGEVHDALLAQHGACAWRH